MKCVVGIDQGTSGTRAVISDLKGNLVSVGYAKGGNPVIMGLENTLVNIASAIDDAKEKASAVSPEIVRIGAGICGVDTTAMKRIVMATMKRRFSVPCRVINDCMIALKAETQEQSCMVICAGSGMNIGLIAPDHSEFCFGFFIDEQHQGGEAIGRATVQAVSEGMMKMREVTGLTEAVLRHYDQLSVLSLLEWINVGGGRFIPDVYRNLVPVVDREAAAGDPVAIGILKDFADICARYAAGGMRMYNMLDIACQIYLSGSVFKSCSGILNDTLRKRVSEINPKADVLDAVFEPVIGGVIIALQDSDKISLPDEVWHRVRECAKEFGLTRQKYTV